MKSKENINQNKNDKLIAEINVEKLSIWLSLVDYFHRIPKNMFKTIKNIEIKMARNNTFHYLKRSIYVINRICHLKRT